MRKIHIIILMLTWSCGCQDSDYANIQSGTVNSPKPMILDTSEEKISDTSSKVFTQNQFGNTGGSIPNLDTSKIEIYRMRGPDCPACRDLEIPFKSINWYFQRPPIIFHLNLDFQNEAFHFGSFPTGAKYLMVQGNQLTSDWEERQYVKNLSSTRIEWGENSLYLEFTGFCKNPFQGQENNPYYPFRSAYHIELSGDSLSLKVYETYDNIKRGISAYQLKYEGVHISIAGIPAATHYSVNYHDQSVLVEGLEIDLY